MSPNLPLFYIQTDYQGGRKINPFPSLPYSPILPTPPLLSPPTFGSITWPSSPRMPRFREDPPSPTMCVSIALWVNNWGPSIINSKPKVEHVQSPWVRHTSFSRFPLLSLAAHGLCLTFHILKNIGSKEQPNNPVRFSHSFSSCVPGCTPFFVSLTLLSF